MKAWKITDRFANQQFTLLVWADSMEKASQKAKTGDTLTGEKAITSTEADLWIQRFPELDDADPNTRDSRLDIICDLVYKYGWQWQVNGKFYYESNSQPKDLREALKESFEMEQEK